MSCSIKGCPGEYETRQIAHTCKHNGKLIIIDGVPAEVCSVCGDTLLKWETVRKLHSLLEESKEPIKTAPIYDYAQI